ncbi:MAG TPA: peptidyl-prolyl cis-trans isomerase [Steroidobacteraceae bacterium]|nr:peptidyl-prolyl cis-trans isomerase [Steroidobacteraceae bacterium]
MPNPTEQRRTNVAGGSSRRSFVLMGAGALLGLLMAGYSLFTARGTSTMVVPPEDVALINQQPISRSDYLLQLQTLYGVDLRHATAAQRRQVLDDMIREELLVQRGKELDVASADPEVRAAMVNAVELEIAADAIAQQPTEAQLRVYYASHRARYASEGTMSLRDYVFPPSESRAAAEAAETPQFTTPTRALLERWHASASGKVADEEFYFAAKIHLGDRLFEAARDLADGRVSAPVSEADGIHILYMIKNKKPVPLNFAAARDQVLTDYRNEAIGHLRTGDEAFLRKRANILIAEDVR